VEIDNNNIINKEIENNEPMQPKKFLKGMIRLYIGPMFSGKTSSLLEAYTRHTIGQKKCLLVKHTNDNRYSDVNVVVHDGRCLSSSAICDSLYVIDNIATKYQVICIDEIQFFEDAPIFCDKWANQGIIVEASGLCGTFTRSEFPVISKLIPLAEEVYKKSAICRETGKDAQFTYRTSNEVETVVIGGIDKYKPVDRKTFFENNLTQIYKNYEVKIFSEFVDIISKKYDILMSDNYKNELLKVFESNNDQHKCFKEILIKFLDEKHVNYSNSF
jgi:thymidine kinase